MRARALLVAVVVALAAFAPVGGGSPAQAAPPGADGRIAFVRGNQIYTMSREGASIKRLTWAGKNYRPEWSPDGRRISYIHEADGRRDVWVMNAGGGSKRAVTTTGDVTSAGASWSPDGRTLAYASRGVLRLISATELGAAPTTPSGYESNSWCAPDPLPVIPVDRFLAWSPDGSRIAVFNRQDCYFDYALWMFHPVTGETFQYRALGADCCGYADWSDLFFGPTGEFGYTERNLGDYGDERGPRLIVYPGFASNDGDTGGAPSPSGHFMAFTNNASGTAYVMRADIDGTDRRRLTVGYQPDWRPRP